MYVCMYVCMHVCMYVTLLIFNIIYPSSIYSQFHQIPWPSGNSLELKRQSSGWRCRCCRPGRGRWNGRRLKPRSGGFHQKNWEITSKNGDWRWLKQPKWIKYGGLNRTKDSSQKKKLVNSTKKHLISPIRMGTWPRTWWMWPYWSNNVGSNFSNLE